MKKSAHLDLKGESLEREKPEEESWNWIPCNYNLKIEDTSRSMIWSLKPSIVLTNKHSDQDPELKLFVDNEKKLNFSKEIGWNWHKSWNLPNISIKLEVEYIHLHSTYPLHIE